jgi:hypothetical protein
MLAQRLMQAKDASNVRVTILEHEANVVQGDKGEAEFAADVPLFGRAAAIRVHLRRL